MIPLIRGWAWITDKQRARVADAIPRTLSANAWRSELGTTWPPIAVSRRAAHLCQYCHGAPGMVTTFADAPFIVPLVEELLLEGGELTWQAGPLAKGPGLCHGTGGNGYAFLKLYRHTKNADWLHRARAFAMQRSLSVVTLAFGTAKVATPFGLGMLAWQSTYGIV